MAIGVDGTLTRYMIRKGSVAVDGISLTINEVAGERFDISIIPHTAKLTTLIDKKIGAPVNIETDMIGKYVERFVGAPAGRRDRLNGRPGAFDWEAFAKNGI